MLASQVASTTVGIPPELRANLPGKVLLGAKPTDGNRRLALANHDHIPTVPAYIADASGGVARGVGVFEFEGKTPGVFKGFFNQPVGLRRGCGAGLRLALTRPRHEPRWRGMCHRWPRRRWRGASAPAAATAAGNGHRRRARRHTPRREGRQLGRDRETGRRLAGYVKANRARQVSAQQLAEPARPRRCWSERRCPNSSRRNYRRKLRLEA